MAQTMQYLKTRLARLYNKKSSALSQLNIINTVVLCLALLFLSGCAGPQQETKQRRYFWPPLPDTPKIEWIGAYSSQNDFPKTSGQMFKESIVGETDSKTFQKPWGVVSNGEGKVYVTDNQAAAVIVYDLNAKTVEYLGKENYEGLFESPMGIALDGSGNLYVSDSKKNRVFVFTKDGEPVMAIGDDSTLNWPTGIAVNSKTGRLYVPNARSSNVAVFDLAGKHLFSFGKMGSLERYFNRPAAVAIDSKGNVIVSDAMNARIQIFDQDGQFIRAFGRRGDGLTDFQQIKGVAVDKEDNIYVVDGRANRFLIFNQSGEALLVVGGAASIQIMGKASPGGFLLPQDIYIDKNNTIFIVDSLNRRFQIFQVIDDGWLKKHPIE